MKKIFTLATAVLASMAMMAEPVVGTYTTLTTNGDESTWTFNQRSSAFSLTQNEPVIDNDMVFIATGNGKIKFQTSSYMSCMAESSVYIPVPAGSEGTIAITTSSSSDSRYFQLYINGTAADDSKRMWSKYSETPTEDGKKGPQSFSFTDSDLTTYEGATYLHFKDNNTEMKIASFILTITGSSTPVTNPVTTVTIDGPAACYVGKAAAYTATTDVKADAYKWFVNDAEQAGAEAKTFEYTPEAAGTYNIVCKAKNEYNEDFVASNTIALVATVKPVAVACANIIPAKSGVAPTEVGTEIDLDSNSEGGKIFVAGMKTPGESIVYHELGLGLMKGGADSVRVEFNNYIDEGSVIKLVIVANGNTERGLKLQTTAKSTLLDAKWVPEAAGEVKEFEYTVPAGSKLIGDYRILLARNNSVYLQSVQMSDCGEARDIPADTDPVLNVSKSAVSLDVTPAMPNPSVTVKFTGKNLTAGTYNLVVPNLAGLSVNPTAVTVAEDGKLDAEVTIAYTSEADVEAAATEIKLTINELTASVAINYSAKMKKLYLNQSINIEQWVLDNGKDDDTFKGLLANANIDYFNIDALDSLNDTKDNRNYAFLGLKLKKADASLSCWLQAGHSIAVRFGNVGADFKVYANGMEQTLTAEGYANTTVESDKVLVMTNAPVDTYLQILCNTTKTLVVKQIMLDEAVAPVVLPETPTAIENTEAEIKATKVVRDGQMMILKNGVLYNMQGAVVK